MRGFGLLLIRTLVATERKSPSERDEPYLLIRFCPEALDSKFDISLRDVPALLVIIEASEAMVLELTHKSVVLVELVGSHLPVRVECHCGSHPSTVRRVVALAAEEDKVAQSIRSSPATGNDVVNIKRYLVQRGLTVHTVLTITDEHRFAGGLPVFCVVHGRSVRHSGLVGMPLMASIVVISRFPPRLD